MMRKLYILLGIVLLVLAGLALTRCGPLPEALPQTDSIPQAADTTAAATPDQTEPITNPRTEAVEKLLSQMTLEEKVGQVFFMRCPTGNEAAVIAQYHPAGYVLFAQDFENRTPDTLRQVLATCQESSKIPLLIGVDEEGGSVVRASKYTAFRKTAFSSPQAVFASGGMEHIRQDAAEKAQFLNSLHINVNLAPVCDVSTDSADFIYARAFGQDAQATAEYVSVVTQEMQKNGVACVLKHFPGYGGNQDTHNTSALDTRPLEALQQNDFLPFTAGIDAGAGCVLFAHTIIASIDDTAPASFSAPVHELLWNELNFRGVCLTDDLAMGAVQEFAAGEDAAILALKSGNDLLLSSDFAAQYQAVLQAVQAGTLSEDVLNTAVQNVLGWKYDMDLLSLPTAESALS